MTDLKEQIEPILKRFTEKQNQELIEITTISTRTGNLIRVVVGSQKGPTVSNLAQITKDFNAFVQENELFNFDYKLEVSSPGLDRPLKDKGDFNRNIDREIEVKYLSDDDEIISTTGTIKSVTADSVIIANKTEDKEIIINKIKKALLIIKFGK